MPEGRWLQALGKLPPEEQEEIMGFAGYEKRQPQPNKETPKEKIIKPILVCMKDVETEEVSWLWEPYIPKGKITMLEGDPGLGKTWMALMLTAIVSNGNPFPSSIDGRLGPRRQPETVLYMSAEDGLADTLKPRLEMVGANTTNVHALTGWTDKPEDTDSFMPINLQDINVLREALEQVKPSLVVIDPIQGYMGPGIDMHRANEVRPVLAGIARLAEQHDCAMICIRHLGKSGQDKAIYRGLGSIDFTATARSVLLVGQDPNRPEKRAIIQIKSSLAKPGPSIGYSIDENGFAWTGISDLDADTILGPQNREEKTALEEAKEFIKDLLINGPVSIPTIKKEAGRAGVYWRTLERAKKELQIQSYRDSTRTWYWRLSSLGYIDGGVGGVDQITETPDLDHVRQVRQESTLRDIGHGDLWSDISRTYNPDERGLE